MNETVLRLAIFVALLLAMVALERRWPMVVPPAARGRVQVANLALAAVSAIVLRLLAPVVGFAAALHAPKHGWGLANLAEIPLWGAAVLGFIALDLAIYAQHRAMHTFDWLWRLHRVHHMETHLDATTALRFHPLEIALSALWRTVVILLLGIPAIAVLMFEIAVNALALFNHANLKLPPRLDHAIRKALVTPAMHRVHHSREPDEQRRNFSFTVPWWDWIFGSYLERSRVATEPQPVGVKDARLSPPLLWAFLVNPFK
jgi:sterol desaturase/sphingolipid hydroxylase (fatty acid hydroxylase superfamily)